MKPGDIFYRYDAIRFICAHDDDNITYVITSLTKSMISVIPSVKHYHSAFADHVRLDTELSGVQSTEASD